MVARHLLRFPLMALAMVALLTGVWAGLSRLGWQVPILSATLPSDHGPLMVSGFLGTLLGLERAVALGGLWAYLGPLSTAFGILALIVDLPGSLGPLLMTCGSLGFVAGAGVITRRQPALFTAVLGLGALAWLVGNALWLAGWPVYRVAPWWAGFLVLTIAGERLELSRPLLPRLSTQIAFLCVTGVFLCGLVVGLVTFDLGVRLAGVGVFGLALWLLRHDIAGRTGWREGLPGFIAICSLSGDVWLGASGVLGLLYGGVMAGPHYDALLHALFLGFVFPMIFGHAPLILPAILGVSIPFRRSFYGHLALLHLSLLLRLVGDLAAWWPGRQWGGLLNAVALGVFLVNIARAVRMTADKR